MVAVARLAKGGVYERVEAPARTSALGPLGLTSRDRHCRSSSQGPQRKLKVQCRTKWSRPGGANAGVFYQSAWRPFLGWKGRYVIPAAPTNYLPLPTPRRNAVVASWSGTGAAPFETTIPALKRDPDLSRDTSSAVLCKTRACLLIPIALNQDPALLGTALTRGHDYL